MPLVCSANCAESKDLPMFQCDEDTVVGKNRKQTEDSHAYFESLPADRFWCCHCASSAAQEV
jgi:hypothetical protein